MYITLSHYYHFHYNFLSGLAVIYLMDTCLSFLFLVILRWSLWTIIKLIFILHEDHLRDQRYHIVIIVHLENGVHPPSHTPGSYPSTYLRCFWLSSIIIITIINISPNYEAGSHGLFSTGLLIFHTFTSNHAMWFFSFLTDVDNHAMWVQWT